MNVRLPYDYSRCTAEPLPFNGHGVPCPAKQQCKRYLAQGRDEYQSFVYSHWRPDDQSCDMRIAKDD